MKTSIISLFILVLLSFGCEKDTSDYIAVIYVENVCCENLEQVISTQSRPVIEYFYATNLEAYDIQEDYQFGDTLLIEYKSLVDSEEIENFDNCISICNRLSGELIKIMDIAEY